MKSFRYFNTIALIVLVLITLFPFVNLIAQAFSSDGAIRAGMVNLWPVGFNTTTLEAVVADPWFWRGYRNTVIYTVLHTIIAMVLTTFFAYAISKRHLWGRKVMTGLAVFTMFFSGGMVPHFIVVGRWLGMHNTMWAVILPGALSVFNVLVMKSFFENFPTELEEAAKLDGLSNFRVFARIVLPLSKAVIATMTLFYAVGMWNSWFGAFMFLDNRADWPVMMYLRNLIAGVQNMNEIASSADLAQVGANIQAVTMLLTVLPIMCIYPFVQKYFVSGIMLGSVKG